MKKILLKILSFVLVIALTAGITLTGTLAFLQKEVHAVNVMTTGNVDIAMHEYQRADGIDYKNGGAIADGDELVPFVQGQPLYPTSYTDLTDYTAKTPNDEQFWWGPYVTADVTGNGSSNGLWDDKLTGVMDKFVFVENTGSSDCYYRTLIAFECPEGMEYSEGSDKEFMMNLNLNNRFTWSPVTQPLYITVDGTRYLVMEAVYNQALKPGEISRPSLLQVVMTHNATSEDMVLIGDTYEILVLSQAVQVENMTGGAAAALDKAFGETTAATAAEWFGGFASNVKYVSTAAEAQAALDNAPKGTFIVLAPNVDYGTLYLRPTTENPATKTVDWIGNNYGYESYSCFENLTILGAEGATIDAIEIEGGTYYNTEHSQSGTYPVMLSLVELKNVTIDGVTFTGEGGYDPQGYGNAINLSGNNIKVDGLTLKNCTLNDTSANGARLLYKTESTTHVHNYTYDGASYTFSPSLKDITITGCTLNGKYMGLELREAHNVTITNNTFEVGDRNILLVVNTGCTYSGTITITGNTSINAQERFVRADGTGDAKVIITDNTLQNYQGEDSDYIKVTNGNNVTIENNTVTVTP